MDNPTDVIGKYVYSPTLFGGKLFKIGYYYSDRQAFDLWPVYPIISITKIETFSVAESVFDDDIGIYIGTLEEAKSIKAALDE
jgi:hypothetical protein